MLFFCFVRCPTQRQAERVSRSKVASEVQVDKQELERVCAHMVVSVAVVLFFVLCKHRGSVCSVLCVVCCVASTWL